MLIRIKIQNHILKSIAVIFTAMLFSCENDLQTVNELTQQENSPNQSLENVEIIYTDSAKLKLKVRAPKLDAYNDAERPYIEFPHGMVVTSYDSLKQQDSRIKANYAIYWQDEDLWEAKKSVEAINKDGDILNTEYLVWDQANHKIYSDQAVKITNADGVIYGKGFDADERMTNWKIRKVTGNLTVDDE